MPARSAIVTAALLLTACGSGAEQPSQPAASPPSANPSSDSGPAAHATAAGTKNWDLTASGEGTALVLEARGAAAIRLFCPAGQSTILVNVAAFRPIGSEERLSFGSGANAHALVADPRGDRLRGGVSGTGAVPPNLAALVGGPIVAAYGSQRSGPHPAPPGGLARAFVTACNDAAGEGAPIPTPNPSPAPGNVSACLAQDGKRLAVSALRAVGTEPFWGARIEGRCVIYSHPEDQRGTRVWTRYTPREGGGGIWSGALGGRSFELSMRPRPGCSDGMSDKRYPLAVELLVNGERRNGCAEPS